MRVLYILAMAVALFSFSGSKSHAHDETARGKPLTEAVYSDVYIKNWAALAAANAMTFSFDDYQERFSEAQKDFTKLGWDSFSKGLQSSRIVEMVENNRQTVSAAAFMVPTIQAKGTIDERRFSWRLEIPFLVTYTAGNKVRSDKLTLTLMVTRSDEPQNEDGLGIVQWLAVNRGFSYP